MLRSHLVPPLPIHPVRCIRVSIKAARHLEGLDVLGCTHSTGALSDDACQTHLLLHINLESTKGIRALVSELSGFKSSAVSYLDPGVPVVGS